MKKFAMIACLFAMPAFAQDVETVQPVVAVVEAPAPVASEALAENFTAICASSFVLSDKAKLACINNEMPKVAKSGETFRNTGIGGEFNTLIRNIAMLQG